MPVSAPHLSERPGLWMCLICGWTYDESVGDPDSGIAPGTTWDKIPADWSCPECGVKKSEFEMVRI